MKIKKDINHVIFFVLFFELISIFLVTIGFFLGFETTKYNILIYLLINGTIVFLGIIIYCLYFMFCKTYYEFTNDYIKITKKGNIVKVINYDKIRYCEYYGFVTLLLGDSKGGNLIVYYIDDNEDKYIEISFPKKLLKKLNIDNIFIK